MSVHRLSKYTSEDPFSRIPNAAINDPNLDLKSRGLLVVMLSKPDHWRFSEQRLADDCGVSRDQVRTAMKILIDAGYVRRDRVVEDGRPVMVTSVSDTAAGIPTVGNPNVGNPDGGEPQPLSNEVPSSNNGRSNEGGRSRGTRLSDSWQPKPEPTIEAKAKQSGVDFDDQLERFRDYWHAKTTADARKLDWQATWRNWLKRSVDYAPRQRQQSFDPDRLQA